MRVIRAADERPRLDVHEPEIERGLRDTGGKVALAMYDCLKPIVGAVNGVAVGIGATMLLPMTGPPCAISDC